MEDGKVSAITIQVAGSLLSPLEEVMPYDKGEEEGVACEVELDVFNSYGGDSEACQSFFDDYKSASQRLKALVAKVQEARTQFKDAADKITDKLHVQNETSKHTCNYSESSPGFYVSYSFNSEGACKKLSAALEPVKAEQEKYVTALEKEVRGLEKIAKKKLEKLDAFGRREEDPNNPFNSDFFKRFRNR